jgi:hypothetical protein
MSAYEAAATACLAWAQAERGYTPAKPAKPRHAQKKPTQKPEPHPWATEAREARLAQAGLRAARVGRMKAIGRPYNSHEPAGR